MEKEPDFFDTIETQLVYDIFKVKHDLYEIINDIEGKEKTGSITYSDVRFYSEKIKHLRFMTLSMSEIPEIKFYKKYKYFEPPKNTLSKTFYN